MQAIVSVSLFSQYVLCININLLVATCWRLRAGTSLMNFVMKMNLYISFFTPCSSRYCTIAQQCLDCKYDHCCHYIPFIYFNLLLERHIYNVRLHSPMMTNGLKQGQKLMLSCYIKPTALQYQFVKCQVPFKNKQDTLLGWPKQACQKHEINTEQYWKHLLHKKINVKKKNKYLRLPNLF
jgi:hypothetical protein